MVNQENDWKITIQTQRARRQACWLGWPDQQARANHPGIVEYSSGVPSGSRTGSTVLQLTVGQAIRSESVTGTARVGVVSVELGDPVVRRV